MGKFDITKLAEAKWIMYAGAAFAAIGAFATSIQDQKKEKVIKELVERVSNLEKDK